MICGLASLVFSMLGIQFTACNLGRGIWRSAFPSRKSPTPGKSKRASTVHWPLMMWSLSWRKWLPETQGEGRVRAQEVAASLPSCHAALVNRDLGNTGLQAANASCWRAQPYITRLLKKPFAYFPSLASQWLLAPSFLSGAVFVHK